MKFRREIITELLNPKPEVRRTKKQVDLHHRRTKRNWWQWDEGRDKNERKY